MLYSDVIMRKCDSHKSVPRTGFDFDDDCKLTIVMALIVKSFRPVNICPAI